MSKLAWESPEFINRPENIALRMQMELQHPYQILRDNGIKSTVGIFGSARINKDNEKHKNVSKYLDVAEEFAFRVTTDLSKPTNYTEYCIATGSGPSIMLAGNKGAKLAGGHSIGMSIELPFEAGSNSWVDEEYDFKFKYFALRKFHMLKIAKAICVFPGGIGTVYDELGEVLTLIQTQKMPNIPIVLFGGEFWNIFKHQLKYFEDNGLTSVGDFSQILYTDSIDESIQYIKTFHKIS